MKQRMQLYKVEPEAQKVVGALKSYVDSSTLDKKIIELVKLRASQINGCTYCMDLHSFDAIKAGVTEQQLYTLNNWREISFFTEQEQAALALTESVTLLASTHVPDDVYEEAARRFTENELAQLIIQIVVINALNRIGVTTRMTPAERK